MRRAGLSNSNPGSIRPIITIKSLIFSLTAGLVIAFMPLIGYLHFESAFAAGIAGAGLSVWQGVSTQNDAHDLDRLSRVLCWVYASAIPLLIKDLLIGCFSVDGLGFWIFLPAPTIFFTFGLTRLLSRFRIHRSRLVSSLLVIMIALGGFLLEFYTLPQVYFYNHIWGYWPGPIYDEALHLGWPLVFYRTLTLCWGILFWLIPEVGQHRSGRWLVGMAAVALMLGYLNLGETGIVRPASVLQEKFNNQVSTERFDLHYPENTLSRQTAEYYGLRHEFFYRQIADTLGLNPRTKEKTLSFVYAHPWQKKELVGAKFTSYVPVWLDRDQLHIAYPQLSSSLHHELVHVAAKPFGNALLNASWSIGKVEGLAVALAQNSSSLSTVDQLVAAKKPFPSADKMRRALSFFGFYGERQAVSYTTSGSFIAYLLRNYDVEYFKKAYASSQLAAPYPVSLDSLVEGWHRHLSQVETDSIDRSRRAALFSIPSIFEKQCPHVLSGSQQIYDQYNFLMAERDTSAARELLDRRCPEACDNPGLWAEWAWYKLKEGRAGQVLADTAGLQFNPNKYPAAALRIADALFTTGNYTQARRKLGEVPFAENAIGALQQERVGRVRGDSSKWSRSVRILYGRYTATPASFRSLAGPLKSVVLRRWMARHQWDKLTKYVAYIEKADIRPLEFETYLKVGRRLVFSDSKSEISETFIAILDQASTRQRHRQMVQSLREWRTFVGKQR